MTNRNVVDNVKRTVSLVEYFQGLIDEGRIAGEMSGGALGEYKMCCPFHGEATPSFHINDSRFHCFGCGAHGDIFAAIMHFDKLTFKEILRQYGELDTARATIERECKMPYVRAESERAAICIRQLPIPHLLRLLLYEVLDAGRLAECSLISIHTTSDTPTDPLVIISRFYRLEDNFSGRMKALLIYEELCEKYKTLTKKQ